MLQTPELRILLLHSAELLMISIPTLAAGGDSEWCSGLSRSAGNTKGQLIHMVSLLRDWMKPVNTRVLARSDCFSQFSKLQTKNSHPRPLFKKSWFYTPKNIFYLSQSNQNLSQSLRLLHMVEHLKRCAAERTKSRVEYKIYYSFVFYINWNKQHFESDLNEEMREK